MYAVLVAALTFALIAPAVAQVPSGEDDPEKPTESHVEASADPNTAGEPTEPHDPISARATAIQSFLDGSLDPAVDARTLFVFAQDSLGVELLAALSAEPPPQETPPEEPGSQPEAVDAPARLRAALAAFIALEPAARQALFDAHDAKADAAFAEQRQGERWAADAERLQMQAEALERLAAGEVEPGAEIDERLRVDALAFLPLEAPPEVEAEGGELFVRRTEAAQRLQGAYAAWLELPAEERQRLREVASTPPEPEPEIEIEIPEEFVDEEEARDREDISDAEQEAADAAREQEEALVVASKARSEALRVVAEMRAELLGIKQRQALFAADLPRWKQSSRDLHENALEWHRKVDELAGLGGGAVEADALYQDVRSALDEARAALAEALERAANPGQTVPAPSADFDDARLPADVDRGDVAELLAGLDAEVEALTAEELRVAWEVAELLRDDVVMLNRARLRLLLNMSSETRDELTGLGTPGRAQARRELGQIALELRYHAMSLPRDIASLSTTVRERPVRIVITALELLVLVSLFRWWRGLADAVLRRWRGPTWGFTQTPAQRLRSSAIWYLMKVRRPVEWLLLLAVLPMVVGTASKAPELRLIWMVLVWVQGARAVVLTVDAVAERQSVYGAAQSGNAELRYRSLRLIGLTVTAVGLILTLTSDIVGQGTIYRWVLQGCWVLVAPIGIWLVVQWRPTILTRLEMTAKTSTLAGWVVNNQKGLLGFLSATVGGVWLLVQGVSAWMVRQLSGLDTTRKVLAYLFRREVAKQAESAAKGPRGEPLQGVAFDQLGPESRSTTLLPLEEPARDLVTEALDLANSKSCTLSVVVGERGMGKTTFLKRVVARSDETTCVVGCPPAGFEALLEALAVQFDAPDFEQETVAKTIRATGRSIICIDDAQRMIAPAVGGLEQLDRFTRFALQVGGEASWIVAVQEAAWHFVERARGERVFFDQVLLLPRWTEDQISTLIQRRTREADLRPDFDALVVGSEATGTEEGRRTELGYYRILWDHSGGNPAVALQAWRYSLFVGADPNNPVVRLFEEPSATEIERLPPTLLFVLRAIVQLELASPDEVADCTQLPVPDVADAIRFSVAHGYVEPTSGRYRLSWTWYRTITRVLSRQHLLVS
ncbi:MAG: ATP-binding protein [bacterium]|nr:ATP-binding protein [bacterium]